MKNDRLSISFNQAASDTRTSGAPAYERLGLTDDIAFNAIPAGMLQSTPRDNSYARH